MEQHSLGCILNHRGIGSCNGDLNDGRSVGVVIGAGWCCESKVMVVMSHSLWFQRRHDGCDDGMHQY